MLIPRVKPNDQKFTTFEGIYQNANNPLPACPEGIIGGELLLANMVHFYLPELVRL